MRRRNRQDVNFCRRVVADAMRQREEAALGGVGAPNHQHHPGQGQDQMSGGGEEEEERGRGRGRSNTANNAMNGNIDDDNASSGRRGEDAVGMDADVELEIRSLFRWFFARNQVPTMAMLGSAQLDLMATDGEGRHAFDRETRRMWNLTVKSALSLCMNRAMERHSGTWSALQWRALRVPLGPDEDGVEEEEEEQQWEQWAYVEGE